MQIFNPSEPSPGIVHSGERIVMRITGNILLGLVGIAMFTGCSTWMSVRPEKQLGDGETGNIHFNQAEYRAIVSVPRSADDSGGKFITCIEPSPDIAKVFGSAFGVAGEGTERTSGISAGLAISMSRAESAAQLGERLATIQLLRDVLYRACEAYANGALNATSYSVIMSRMDDMIVTMLLGELSVGNFGRQLASLSSAAGGSGLAGGEGAETLADALKEQRAAEAELLEETQELESAVTAAENCSEDELEIDGETATGNSCEKAEEDVDKARDAQAESEARAVLARARTRAVATAVTGGITAAVNDKQSEMLTTLARKYIENVNFDALMVACLHALQGPGMPERSGSVGSINVVSNSALENHALPNLTGSTLAATCQQMMTDGAFDQLMESEIRMIEAKKRRVDIDALANDMGHLAQAVSQLRILLNALSKGEAPQTEPGTGE